MRRIAPLLAAVAVLAAVGAVLARRGEPVGATPHAPLATSAAEAPSTTATTAPEPPAPAPVPAPAGGTALADPPRFPTTVAVAAVPDVSVHDTPEGTRRAVLHSPVPFSHFPVVFTVVDEPAAAPPGWLHVWLRTRPNGSSGWIRAAEVTVSSHRWSIDVNLTAHHATVFDGDRLVVETPVVTGTAAAPTPVGDFFTTEGVWTGQPGGAYGPYIFGLSAHSEVYAQFGGGDGQVGLHGTNQPGLLGTSASHGCVRFPNDVITMLARTLPVGVPVHIHR